MEIINFLFFRLFYMKWVMMSVPEMGNIMTVEAEEIMDENDMQGNGSGDGEQETDNEESGSSVGEEKGGISGGDSENGGIAPCAEEIPGKKNMKYN